METNAATLPALPGYQGIPLDALPPTFRPQVEAAAMLAGLIRARELNVYEELTREGPVEWQYGDYNDVVVKCDGSIQRTYHLRDGRVFKTFPSGLGFARGEESDRFLVALGFDPKKLTEIRQESAPGGDEETPPLIYYGSGGK